MIINKMDNILKDNEWIPNLNDIQWKHIKNENYKIYQNPPNIEYTINDNIINQVKKYNKLYQQIKSKIKQKEKINNIKITKIYIVYNNENTLFEISYTTNTILHSIKLSLNKYLSNDPSLFDNFMTLKGLKIKLLECILGNITKKELMDKKKEYKEIYDKQKINLPKNNIKKYCIETIKNISYDISLSYEKNITCYIYEFNNNFKKYISGSFNKITKKTILELYNKMIKINSLIDDDINKWKLKILEIYKSSSEFDCWIHVDYYIFINNSIENGYNLYYNVIENYINNDCISMIEKEHIKKNIFLKIQKEYFNKFYKDQTNYNILKTIIYYIKTIDNNKMFIGHSKKDLIYTINDLYNKAIENKKKYSKISRILSTIPYNKLEIGILKKINKTSKEDPITQENKLIKKYNTIEDGYNMNTKSLRLKNYLSKIIK